VNLITKPGIIVSINKEGKQIPSINEDYVLMREADFNAVLDNTNLSILLAIMQGHTRFVEIMRRTGINKGKLARRLKRLLDSGWVVKDGDKYMVGGRVFVVYDIGELDGNVVIHISTDKGAFVDPVHGLVVINGEPLRDYCSSCPLRQVCVDNVKYLARRYGIKVRGVEPSEAYVELFRELVRKDLIRKLRGGYRLMIRR